MIRVKYGPVKPREQDKVALACRRILVDVLPTPA